MELTKCGMKKTQLFAFAIKISILGCYPCYAIRGAGEKFTKKRIHSAVSKCVVTWHSQLEMKQIAPEMMIVILYTARMTATIGKSRVIYSSRLDFVHLITVGISLMITL